MIVAVLLAKQGTTQSLVSFSLFKGPAVYERPSVFLYVLFVEAYNDCASTFLVFS